MMKKTTVVAYLFIFFFFMGINNQIFADSAEVLPKGVFRANVTTNLYFPIDERFNPDGNTESVATDFNKNLNSGVFPDLDLVEAAFSMPLVLQVSVGALLILNTNLLTLSLLYNMVSQTS